MADNKEVAKPDHRRRVVMELIATEESYVKSLGVLVEKYHVPLKKLAAEGSPILTVAEMEVVFKNCDILFGLNKTLLSDLQAAGPGGDVGAIFKRFAPFLKMYHAYLDNNSVAMNLVATKLKAEAESNALLDIVTKGSQQPKLADFMASRGETLESLMIKPVQRLPRYKMLLEELLKPGCAACVSEEQNAAIRDALAKVAEVAAFCNTSIALHKEYMEWVELHLQFGEALPVNRDRQILREGTLSKWNRHGQAQRKYVILFSDALAYGKANTKGKLAKDISAEEVFLFSSAQRAVLASATSVTKMVVLSQKKSFVMQLKSSECRDEWVTAINDAVTAFDAQRAGGQRKNASSRKGISGVLHRAASRAEDSDSPAVSPAEAKAEAEQQLQNAKVSSQTRYAPVWQPDTDECQLCCKAYSYFTSRHHCRRCGVCMCNSCGNFDCVLKYVDPRRRCRICRVCYMLLRPPGADLTEEDLVMIARCYNVGCLRQEEKDKLIKAASKWKNTQPPKLQVDSSSGTSMSAEDTARATVSPINKQPAEKGFLGNVRNALTPMKAAGKKMVGAVAGALRKKAVPPPLPSRESKPKLPSRKQKPQIRTKSRAAAAKSQLSLSALKPTVSSTAPPPAAAVGDVKTANGGVVAENNVEQSPSSEMVSEFAGLGFGTEQASFSGSAIPSVEPTPSGKKKG